MANGKLNSFLKLFQIDDDYDEYDDYDDVNDYDEPSVRKTASLPDDDDDDLPKKPFRVAKPKVVPMSSNTRAMEVNIIKPSSFEDSQEICNTLLMRKPVVVNLEGFNPDDAQRIMDFISGCIYAINGKFHQISKYIFIFSPENVDISGDSLSFTGDSVGTVPTLNREF